MNPKIANKALKLFTNEGINKTHISSIKLYKSSSYEPLTNFIYDLCFVVVLQGKKIAHLNNNIFTYDCDNYLVIPTTLPLKCETHATKKEPFLGIIVSINKDKMYEIISSIQNESIKDTKQNLGIFSDSITDEFENIIERLVNTLYSKEESNILGASFINELYYRIAKGNNAEFLYKMFSKSSNENKILESIKIIREGNIDMDISGLARQVNMSETSFYNHFKKVTSLTPLQYTKNIRLNRAKNMLLNGNYKVVEIADKLGYTNPAIFSRDFKNYFGFPPKELRNNSFVDNVIS